VNSPSPALVRTPVEWVVSSSDGDLIRCEITEGAGIDVCSVEAERRLVPLVGPTVFLLVRHLIRRVDEGGAAECFLIADLAGAMGVPPAKIAHALKRALRFRLVSIDRGSVVVARRWTDRKAGS
jgi:hypothetical protein